MFAALLLPAFCLQSVLRWQEVLWAEAVAVVDETTAQGTVLEITAAAKMEGVLIGMASTQAMARCSELRLVPRSRSQEQNVNALLLEIAGALSPDVEMTGDGICTVDLRRTPIADWSAWMAQVFAMLDASQLRARIGVTANPDLALLAARRAEPWLIVQDPAAFLSGLAVAEIDPPPELLAVLRDWGIHHLGQLAHLSKSEIMDRLGPEAGLVWQRATGKSERLLRYVRPVEEFVESFDFEHELETIEPLLFILRRFLEQLSWRLKNAGRVAGKMLLTLPLENGRNWERLFTIPSPTADAEVLLRILHTHLETLRLEQRPTAIRLLIQPVRSDHQQFQLFENPLRDPNRFGETVARLAALVGATQAGVPECEASHRPDRFRLVEPQFQTMEAATIAETPDVFAVGLPLRRYRPPFPAQVHLQRQIPMFVFSEKAHGEIIDVAGPYRISGGWWEGEGWGTEEWDVEVAGGGLFRLSRQKEAWFVEGCYDAAIR